MRLKRILEIGGDGGYSATNFLKAIGGNGIVYTVDLKPTPSLAVNHKVIVKNALSLEPSDIDDIPSDLIFFVPRLQCSNVFVHKAAGTPDHQ
jgi:hypothetical protein